MVSVCCVASVAPSDSVDTGDSDVQPVSINTALTAKNTLVGLVNRLYIYFIVNPLLFVFTYRYLWDLTLLVPATF